MPVINRITEFHEEITAWRRDIHENPEILFDVNRTAGKVTDLLKSFGVDDVVTGLGKTGVVGVIKGRQSRSGKVIGLRADMDALPIFEKTGKAYASKNSGKMHACGHDGHTAMLLGAAKYLAETRNFDGTVIVIFQPAEEGGGGGRVMVQDGLMERFGIEEVFGMHNMPGLPVGEFAIREGGMMASTDEFTIEVEGTGGHAAMPNKSNDPVVAAAHLIVGLQTIVSRNVDPMRPAVLSVTMMQAGSASNVIPASVKLTGTVRTLDEEVRALMEERLREVSVHITAAYGASAKVSYRRGYPVTVNAGPQTRFAVQVAQELAGKDRVDDNVDPVMGAEDFSYMAQARPGAFIFMGNGDTAQLHQDTYDFNDEAIPVGCSYWIRLVETAMPAA
jgi:hippurate hydrolase